MHITAKLLKTKERENLKNSHFHIEKEALSILGNTNRNYH